MRLRLGRYDVETRPCASLLPAELDALWAFAERFTEGSREGFLQSLQARQDAVLIRERSTGTLVGLGAVDVVQVQDEAGRARVVIFPGHTLFDERVRGNTLIQRIGFRYFLRARLRHPLRPVCMAYTTFSYKSYLMLPRNFGTFWPRPEQPTPPAEARFLERVARRYFGDGVRCVGPDRFLGHPGRALKAGVATVEPALLEDPYVRFFHETNPEYAQGWSLVVLVPLSLANWLSVARNFVRRARRPKRR